MIDMLVPPVNHEYVLNSVQGLNNVYLLRCRFLVIICEYAASMTI